MINFGTGKLIAVPTSLSDGTPIVTPTPVILGTMQDINVDLSVEMKTLHGSKRYPISAGQGKGKIEVKAKYAEIQGAILGSLFFGRAGVDGIKAAVFEQGATIPASPYQVTIMPPASGSFVADMGVIFADGTTLKRVGSGPAAGEYAINTGTGVYTFAAADAGKIVLISYEYSAPTGGQVFAITNDVMGYTPSFSMLLQTSYDGKILVCKLNRNVSGQLTLPFKNDDFAIYDFNSEAFADSANNIGYFCLIDVPPVSTPPTSGDGFITDLGDSLVTDTGDRLVT